MFFAPKSVKAVGIDISESSIKVMQLSGKRGVFYPVAHSAVDFPPQLVANHMISDEGRMAEFITRAVAKARHVNTKYAVVSVPEAKSFVRILKLPKMPESEMDTAIPWELEQDIPVPIEQVYFDWRFVKEEGDYNHILVTVTPRDYVDALVNSLKLAKIKPVALEMESQATARALIGAEDRDKTTLVIDMTTYLTSFIIVAGNGILEYTSNIPVGGSHLTEAISTATGLKTNEAEALKVKQGLLGESKKGNIKQAMLVVLDSIVSEIRNVVKFYEDHASFGGAVSKIVLTGGSANLIGLPDYLNARLSVGAGRPIERITIGDPWINALPKDKRANLGLTEQQAIAYSTAIGLALRGAKP